MVNQRLTIQITGTATAEGDVRLGEFIKELAAIKQALTETDRVLSPGRAAASLDFIIVELRHTKPAQVVLEALPLIGAAETIPEVTVAFVQAVSQIQGGQIPRGFDYSALQAFKEMTALVGNVLSELRFTSNGASTALRQALGPAIEGILGPDEYEWGSITGILDRIHINAGQRIFWVYAGRRSRVRCLFPEALLAQAVEAVGKYVNVFGQLRSKRGYSHPYEMVVRRIEVYPPVETLPTLDVLRGSAPDLTDGQRSEEWVRDRRDEW